MLVISGAILNGCSRSQPDLITQPELARPVQVLTNNTYVEGRGYYHAPHFGFYPHPYNFFMPGRGYYHGGDYSPEPERSSLTASAPGKAFNTASHVDRGGFVRGSTESSHVSS
jgi:hypothetical protein